ncbi:MAG: hypothetical protein DMG90_17065 [Acidobacteria bacterium]|nr:MAG: hypothetical protein DMG90_17065 [Acidobacteriota bacterium]
MYSAVGIFSTREQAQSALKNLRNSGIPERLTIFLTSETFENQLNQVPTTDAERDGMGPAMGAVLGGAVGASTGLTLGSVVASLMVPGVGPIMAAGLGAAAVLGVGGAVAGGEIGNAAEKNLDVGVPRDDVFFYRELLKRGRSLVIVNTEQEDEYATANDVMAQSGGEDVNAARHELRGAA